MHHIVHRPFGDACLHVSGEGGQGYNRLAGPRKSNCVGQHDTAETTVSSKAFLIGNSVACSMLSSL